MRKLLAALLGCAMLVAAEKQPAVRPYQATDMVVCSAAAQGQEGAFCSRLMKSPDGRLRFERIQIEQ